MKEELLFLQTTKKKKLCRVILFSDIFLVASKKSKLDVCFSKKKLEFIFFSSIHWPSPMDELSFCLPLVKVCFFIFFFGSIISLVANGFAVSDKHDPEIRLEFVCDSQEHANQWVKCFKDYINIASKQLIKRRNRYENLQVI